MNATILLQSITHLVLLKTSLNVFYQIVWHDEIDIVNSFIMPKLEGLTSCNPKSTPILCSCGLSYSEGLCASRPPNLQKKQTTDALEQARAKQFSQENNL